MVTHTRIQEFANNSEIENSRNKSHAKISEFTVTCIEVHCLCFNKHMTQELTLLKIDIKSLNLIYLPLVGVTDVTLGVTPLSHSNEQSLLHFVGTSLMK